MSNPLGPPGASRWTLRAAMLQDAPAIARFHVSCWTDAYVGIVPDDVLARLDVAERTRRWHARLGAGARSTVVARLVLAGEPIVGLVSWGQSHDPPEPGLPPLELASLYVARDLWGTGLAAALLERAIDGAHAQLWVFEANGRARSFYEKHGFAPDGPAKIDGETGVLECRYVRT